MSFFEENWGFVNERMKVALALERDRIATRDMYLGSEQREAILARAETTRRAIYMVQQITYPTQDLYPETKKTEKVNWQKEGF